MTNLTRTARREISRRKNWYVYITPQQPKPAEMRQNRPAAQLDTFVNVGGNSWLDDDHYCIYSDKEHYEGIWDYYNSVEELAEYAEIPLDELRQKVIAKLELDDDEAVDFELDYYEARGYLQQDDEAMEKLTEAYFEALEELKPEYHERAEFIMDNFNQEH